MQHDSIKAALKCFHMLTVYIFTPFYKTGSAVQETVKSPTLA